jgi:methionine-rich copper-binding protein CopC
LISSLSNPFMKPIDLSRLLPRAIRATAMCAAVTLASAAFAHALPTSREPARNAEVSAPTQVAIHFSEPLEPAFSKITLTDASGKAAASAASGVDAQDRKTMHLAVDALAPGHYTVHWNAVASDGHRTHGDYAFTVK